MVATVNASTSAGVVITPDNSGVLAFQSSSATALTIDASQNVGIGATPNSKLYVRAATNANLRITDASGTLNLSAENDAGSAQVAMKFNGSQMILDATGNLGIGTASPSTKLAVAGGISGTGAINISGSGWGVLSYVANSLVIDNNAGESRFFATGADASTDGSYLFYTSQTDGGTNERMRIESSGNVLINSTSTLNAVFNVTGKSGFSPCSLRVNTDGDYGYTFKNASNTLVGAIGVNTSTTAYNTSSDYRLKENIAPMTGALAKVAQLKPVTYKWKVDGSDGEGFIAHELQEVVPECVSGEKDAVDADGNPVYQGIDTSFLVATLTAAIQELKAINDTQAELISGQAATITTLTARIVALETA